MVKVSKSKRKKTTKHSNKSWLHNKTPKSWLIFGVISVLLLLNVGVAVYKWTNSAQRMNDRISSEMLIHSKYKNIDSEMKIDETKRYSSTIEYPITSNESVNSVVKKSVANWHKDFSDIIKGINPKSNSKFQERISYSVTYNDDNYVSMVLNGQFDTQGANPYTTVDFWTFDMKNGKVVSLKDLAGNDQAHTKKLLAAITSAAQKKLGKDQIFADMITDKNITSFVVGDNKTIAFPFGQGKITPYSAGEVSISVSVDDLVKELQNDIAKSLFDVPEPPKPKPKPSNLAPAPQPVANNPSADCIKQKCVALTFDDGPGPYTEELLGILAKNNVKATFFEIGPNVNRYPGVVKKQHNAGHVIGNHTWDHPDMTTLSVNQQANQLNKTNDAIEAITGQRPTLLRPPYGATNSGLQNTLAGLGMSSVLWSVDTRDWADRDSNIVCNRALANTHAGGVIIMHDIHPTSVNAVQCIVSGLEAKGYSMVTVPQLFGDMKPGANYYGSY